MGVEFELFLIPRENAFRPDGAALSAFIDALRAEKWICDPRAPEFAEMYFRGRRTDVHAAKTGAYVAKIADFVERLRTGHGFAPLPLADLATFFTDERENDLQLVWPVANMGERLRYPLDKESPAVDPEETYYDLELWLPRDYVYKTSEQIHPFDDTRCACGAELAFEAEDGRNVLFHTGRIRVQCTRCGQPFDASKLVATVRDAWTNKPSSLPGGATFRFALLVDCGKCWPDDPDGFHIHPDLRRLCEAHFGRPFYEIVNVH